VFEPRGGQFCKRGAKEDEMQPSAVDADLAKFVAGQLATRFLVDQLSKRLKKQLSTFSIPVIRPRRPERRIPASRAAVR
jgi:hypothetical protein